MMKLTISDIIADIAVIESNGDSVRGIEMGSVMWCTVYDSLSCTEKTATKVGSPRSASDKIFPMLLSYPFRVTESLGKTVNYLLADHPHDPPWISRDDLQ